LAACSQVGVSARSQNFAQEGPRASELPSSIQEPDCASWADLLPASKKRLPKRPGDNLLDRPL